MNDRFNAGRFLARFALLVAFSASLAIVAIAFVVRGLDKPETWAIAAAALAVVTSIISAWSSRRVVELQEDSQKPNLYPTFDFTSRYGLAILRIKNTGGTPAHGISLEWAPELTNQDGDTIGFPMKDGVPAISVLLPGDSISQIIGVHHEFIKVHPDTEYTGVITFQDPSRYTHRVPFRLDGRPFSNTPTYDEEAPKTHYELQKIPGELKAIREALRRLCQKTDR